MEITKAANEGNLLARSRHMKLITTTVPAEIRDRFKFPNPLTFIRRVSRARLPVLPVPEITVLIHRRIRQEDIFRLRRRLRPTVSTTWPHSVLMQLNTRTCS